MKSLPPADVNDMVPHHIVSPLSDEYVLPGLEDASYEGYAACLYLVSDQRANRHSCLLASKAKYLISKAPLKSLSIPHLELLGA